MTEEELQKLPTPRTDMAMEDPMNFWPDVARELERDLACSRNHDESVCAALESRSATLAAALVRIQRLEEVTRENIISARIIAHANMGVCYEISRDSKFIIDRCEAVMKS